MRKKSLYISVDSAGSSVVGSQQVVYSRDTETVHTDGIANPGGELFMDTSIPVEPPPYTEDAPPSYSSLFDMNTRRTESHSSLSTIHPNYNSNA